jgi:3-hydroxyanthranilate 3,4-dioxygenase
MHVNVLHDGQRARRAVQVSEGRMWVLPAADMPPLHRSDPRAGSIGLVCRAGARPGNPGALHGTAELHHLIHDVELQVTDIRDQIPTGIRGALREPAARTCSACGTVHPGKG